MTPRRAFSVAIYPRHQGRVLVIRHRRLATWLPPGGELAPGETPLEAARRELREETGLEGDFPVVTTVDGVPPGLLGYEEHPAGSKGQHLNFVFVADVATDRVVPNDEFDTFRWVTADDPIFAEAPRNVGEFARLAVAAGPPLEAIARRWLEAFNARDLDALLALYTDDAVHESPKLRVQRPETGGRVVGRDALRAWWADAFARLPTLRYETLSLTADGERVFMEYLRRVPGEPDLPVAEILRVTDGRIRSSAVFHG